MGTESQGRDLAVSHRNGVAPGHDGDGGSDGEAPGGWRGRALAKGVERALELQQPLVASRVAALRRKNPDATPAQIIDRLGRQYQAAVAATGGAGGAVAVVPAIGTAISLATAGAEALAALDAAVLYTLAVAEVHALPTDDPERRRALVLGVVVGQSGEEVLRKVTGRKRDWASTVTEALPLSRLGPLNATLLRWLVKRWVTRQSALALGRALPLGVGVAIGAGGNLATAKAVMRSAERAFGAPPAQWPDARPALPEARRD